MNYQTTFVRKPPSSDITTIHGEVSVNPPKLTYNLKTEPNRIYNFDVSAVSCAGSGPKTIATGECITDSEAPDYIEEPNIIDESPGSTRDLEIVLPNEDNGPISCVFVVVKNGPIDNNDLFDIVKLRKVSSEALTDETPNGKEYLAVAMKRYEFSETSITVKLGDEITSGCDVTDKSAKNSINHYDAKNWQLVIGNSYSTYVVTTSPNEEETVLFQQSSIEEFENGSSNPETGTID
ncbi:receptor-type tyrosine-protein phosphatase-like [Styela clava]